MVYYLLSGHLRNLWIVVVSILFYAWGAPQYIFVVLAAMLIDFFIAKKIHSSEGRIRKRFLAFGVTINVLALLYFKYFNFFIENLNFLIGNLEGKPLQVLHVALPIGISFFTFHEISYLVDVYRAKKLPFKRLTDYSLYILFFPQLIAGPIIRFSEISDQISDYKRRISSQFIITGFHRFVIGLTKKVMIANICGAQADYVFSLSDHELSTGTAWIGALAYTMQIYFDFSGYSDMAIGLARMMGFVFPENFNMPYIAKSISEFWRRWHMSLSRWIKDYLYVSLGGNRGSTQRTYSNLIICFLISGFWHGAEWTFILWGVYHGLFLILDRLFLLKHLNTLGKAPAVLITFFFTIMGWVIFRSPDLAYAGMFYQKLFIFDHSNPTVLLSLEFKCTMFIAMICSFLALFFNEDKLVKWLYPETFNKSIHAVGVVALSIMLLLLASGALSVSGFNPFIYFRF
ncbi:MAG: MBOAT family protein [Bacteroidetes bacterium]|nr:MBOAT family protein [Bacteroidota bacterium]